MARRAERRRRCCTTTVPVGYVGRGAVAGGFFLAAVYARRGKGILPLIEEIRREDVATAVRILNAEPAPGDPGRTR